MDYLTDDFPFSPRTPPPQETTSGAATNDPIFNYIYTFLRDDSKTTFEPPSISNPLGASSDSIPNAPINLPIARYQQSPTLIPICTVPAFNGLQEKAQAPCEQRSASQSNDCESRKIRIKTHPRSQFRPRTEKESKDTSHYIRSEADILPGYPTIHVLQSWNKQNNIIEVTLVDKDKQPHPYTIDNKERKTSHLIFKQKELNSLYFHLTMQDYEREEKILLIEFIKPKQDHYITKQLIKARQLDQSMLRFTRFYQLPDGKYQRDDDSTEYSCLMTEDYGHFTVEDVFPLYGPIRGNQKVCVELKGYLPKDLKTDLIIILTGNDTNWSHQIETIQKNRNNFTFAMPPFPYTQIARAEVNILIRYKEDMIYQSTYLYTRKLDDELIGPIPTLPVSNTTIALPVSSGNGVRGTKRARQ